MAAPALPAALAQQELARGMGLPGGVLAPRPPAPGLLRAGGTTLPCQVRAPPAAASFSRAHRAPLAPSRAVQEDAPAAATAAEQEAQGPPQITLRFLKPGAGGDEQEVTLESGTKNLRRAMLDAKVPLYDMYGSLMNCGGGGSCGTCLVDIREGAELLSGRTATEDRFLKKRPESWRLACQTIVGDKTNGGTITVRTMPQKQ